MANGNAHIRRLRAGGNTGQTATLGATGWHPEEIKAVLRMRGTTLRELSRRHGYDPDAARHVVHHRKSARLERIIAELLEVPAHEIWPDRYDAKGKPLDRRRIRSERRTDKTKAARVPAIASRTKSTNHNRRAA